MTLQPTPDELYTVMRQSYDDIIDFVMSEPFKSIVEEMYNLPLEERAEFVSDRIIDQDNLKAAGVIVPSGIIVQRSTFGDGRPTLFVVKKYLSEEYRVAWENVNITFDQEHDEEKIAQGAAAWQRPLPVAIQSTLQVLGMDTNTALA